MCYIIYTSIFIVVTCQRGKAPQICASNSMDRKELCVNVANPRDKKKIMEAIKHKIEIPHPTVLRIVKSRSIWRN